MSDIAFEMQDARDREAGAAMELEERWPLRWSMLFVFVTSVGLWSAIITGISYVV